METKTTTDICLELQSIDEMLDSLIEKRMQLINQQAQNAQKDTYVIHRPTPLDAKTVQNYQRQLHQQMEQWDDTLLTQPADTFLKQGADFSSFTDKTFIISAQGKNDSNADKINATIGSLYSDEGKIVAFKTVYDAYNQISNEAKAAYAEGFLGNRAFRDGIFQWVNRHQNLHLPHDVIATAGGTGAISLCINSFCNAKETILFPAVGWGSYQLMAKNADLKPAFYQLVDQDNQIDLKDLFLQSLRIIKQQKKLVVIINDPCQNPTGISYGKSLWKLIIEFYKKLTEYGPVIIINDVAYIDYCYQDGYDYFEVFNDMNQDMMAVVTFSCSKSFTGYGQRVGAGIVLAKQQESVDRVMNVFSKAARGYWSNINNGFMLAIAEVTQNHLEDYRQECQPYIDLLKQRAQLFIQAAKEVDLTIYPYCEGFFIFVKEDDAQIRQKAHQYLLDHHIYTLNFTGGLRVAICSLATKDCARLPAKIKEALEVARNG